MENICKENLRDNQKNELWIEKEAGSDLVIVHESLEILTREKLWWFCDSPRTFAMAQGQRGCQRGTID